MAKKWVLSVMIGLFILCLAASAGADTVSGTCGDNLIWTLDDNGLLTISGSGAMDDYETGSAPWFNAERYIKSIQIENGVTTIGKRAFNNTRCKFSSINIPQGVVSIEAYAFYGCSSLRTITLPDSLETIKASAFMTTGLTSVSIPDSVTTMAGSVFQGCTQLQSVSLSRQLEEVSSYLFKDCSYLESIYVPGSVKKIGKNAFENCLKLESVTLMYGLQTIESNAFLECRKLSSLAIPISVNSLVKNAFPNNINLIVVDGSAAYIYSRDNYIGFTVISVSNHNMISIPEQPATCEKEGNSGYWICNICGKTFSDANGETEIAENSWILPNSHCLTHIEATAATCTEEGNGEYWTCSACGKAFSDATGATELEDNAWIIPVRHNLTKVTAHVATCEETGNIEYYICGICDKKFRDEDGTDEIEGEDWITQKTQHSLTKVAAHGATCEETGNIEYYTCGTCNKKFRDEDGTEEIEGEDWIITKAPHSLTKVAAHVATCQETGNIEYYTCGICDNKFRDEGGTKEIEGNEWIIPKTSHSLEHHEATTATCAAEGNYEYWDCSACGKIFSDTNGTSEYEGTSWIIPKTSHTLAYREATIPTCTQPGNTEYWTCSECKKSFSDENGENEIEKNSSILKAKGHTMKYHEAKDATCTTAGNIEHWICTACIKRFGDVNGNNELTNNSWKIAALGHRMAYHEAKAATCTEAGNDEYWECSACNKVFRDFYGTSEFEGASWIILAQGHKLKHYPAIAATCTTTGNIEYWICSTCQKAYSDKDGNNAIENDSLNIPALGHKMTYHPPKAATCTEDGNEEYWTCSNCGKAFWDQQGTSVIQNDSWKRPALNHSMTHHPAITVTCTEAGSTEYWTCSNCGNAFSDEDGNHVMADNSWNISAPGHSMEHHIAKAETCTEEGNTEYWTCLNCQKAFSDADGIKEVAIDSWNRPATGHNMTYHPPKAPTCTEAGNYKYWSCSNCGKAFSDKEGETEITENSWARQAKGHIITAHEAVGATCTEPGNTAYWTCETCGKPFSDAQGETEIEKGSWITAATGHSMEHHIARDETCTEAGNTEYWMCLTCQKVFSDVAGETEIEENSWNTAALGHDMTSHMATAATCTEQGNTAYWTCKTCAKSFSDAGGTNEIVKASWIIQATGHIISKVEAKAATCTAPGNIQYWKCSGCEAKFRDEEGTNEITDNTWLIHATGHNMILHEAEVATCTKAGNTAYWTCSTCKKFFSDADGKTEIEENSWITKATGHDLKHVDAKAATCTEAGAEEYWMCETCGELFDDEEGKNEIEDPVMIPITHSLIHHDRVEPTYYEDGTGEYWRCSKCEALFSDSEGKAMIDQAAVIPATGVVARGTCGENLTWILEKHGLLTIRGTGAMADYDNQEMRAPWASGNVSTVSIENGVTSIGCYAFYGCSGITSVSISEQVTSIGTKAFAECGLLKVIELPDALTMIGSDAFPYHAALRAKIGSDGAKTISKAGKDFQDAETGCGLRYMFSGNTVTGLKLTSVDQTANDIVIPEGVTNIDGWIFERLDNHLATITIPDSLTRIERGSAYLNDYQYIRYAHLGSEGAKALGKQGLSFTDRDSQCDYLYQYETDVMIGLKLKTGNKTATAFTVPEGVTVIGASAFKDSEALEEITIPESVKTIENYAFMNCSKLEEVALPDSLASIADSAFTETLITNFLIENCNSYAHQWAKRLEYPCVVEHHRNIVTDPAVAATCITSGLTEGTHCSACGDVIVPQETVYDASAHDWEDIRYSWSEDNLQVTASRVCKNNPEHTISETVKAEAEYLAYPTCEESGLVNYASHAFTNSIFEAQRKDNVVLPALGHDWDDVKYNWSEGNLHVTASRMCKINPEHVQFETVDAKADYLKRPTCEETGLVSYVSNAFINSAFEVQRKENIFLPASGHDWDEPEYNWSEDNLHVTASRVCRNNPEHTIIETVEAKAEYLAYPTCEEAGMVNYVSHAFTNSAFEVQRKENIVLPALGHDWDQAEYKWAEDNLQVTASRKCKNNPEHVQFETVDAEDVYQTRPTCEETGMVNYVSHAFTNNAFEEQRKENVVLPALGHDWDEPEYNWSEDNLHVTASRTCKNNPEHVQSETVDVEIIYQTRPTCEGQGLVNYVSRSFENSAFKAQRKENIVLPASGHDWDEPKYNWSEDNLHVTASRKCKNNPDHVQFETVDAEADYQTRPTCEETGLANYVSHAFTNSAFEEQRKENVSLPALGHNWDQAEYSWSEDNLHVTASRICKNNPEHVQSETADAEAVYQIRPTCEGQGLVNYVSRTYVNSAFNAQRKDNVVLPALGHDWEKAEYNWSEDNLHVTASRTCKHNPGHVQSETVEADAVYQTMPTCEETGLMNYVSHAFTNSAFEEQTKENIVLPALGHDWDEPKYNWSEDNTTVTASRTCKRDSSHKETDTVDTILAVIRQPDCETAGEGTFTTKPFSNPAFSKQEKTAAFGSAAGHQAVILPAVEATCTDSGMTEGEKCSVCGKVLVEQRTVPAKGHTPVVDSGAVEPTCTTPGYTAGIHCDTCNEVLSEVKEIPAAHTAAVDPEIPATAKDSGWTEGSHCLVCGIILEKQMVMLPAGFAPDLVSDSEPWYADRIAYGENDQGVSIAGVSDRISLKVIIDPDGTISVDYCGRKLNGTWQIRDNKIKTEGIPGEISFNTDGELHYVPAHGPYVQENEPSLVCTQNEPAETESLATMMLPSGTMIIEEEAFSESGVQYVILPDQCSIIGPRAFANCRNLMFVYIPDSVTTIDSSAFQGCNIELLICESDNAGAEFGKTNGIKVFVP